MPSAAGGQRSHTPLPAPASLPHLPVFSENKTCEGFENRFRIMNLLVLLFKHCFAKLDFAVEAGNLHKIFPLGSMMFKA